MLALPDMTDAINGNVCINPKESERMVLGIVIDIHSHNRAAIEAHPISSRIHMIHGSSIDLETIDQAREIAGKYERILVCLDSNHTHEHVLAELKAYASLVTPGSYCVVFDTIVEDMPDNVYPDRPWAVGNNPKTAVKEYLHRHPEFEINSSLQNTLMITVAPDGWLKRARQYLHLYRSRIGHFNPTLPNASCIRNYPES